MRTSPKSGSFTNTFPADHPSFTPILWHLLWKPPYFQVPQRTVLAELAGSGCDLAMFDFLCDFGWGERFGSDPAVPARVEELRAFVAQLR